MKLFTIVTVLCALGLAGVRGDAVSCSQIDYLYYSSDCCDNSNTVECMESITQADKAAIDSLANLERADATACQEGDAIHFSANGIVCAPAAAGDSGDSGAATTTQTPAIAAGGACVHGGTSCDGSNQCITEAQPKSACADGDSCTCQDPAVIVTITAGEAGQCWGKDLYSSNVGTHDTIEKCYSACVQSNFTTTAIQYRAYDGTCICMNHPCLTTPDSVGSGADYKQYSITTGGGNAAAATTQAALVGEGGACGWDGPNCVQEFQCITVDNPKGACDNNDAETNGGGCTCQDPAVLSQSGDSCGNLGESACGNDAGCMWLANSGMCVTGGGGDAGPPPDLCADAGGVKISETLCVELVADNSVTTTQIKDAGKDLSDAECQAVVDYYAAKCDNTAGACGFDLYPYGISYVGMNGIHGNDDPSFFPICYINTYKAEHNDLWVYKANPSGNENTCGPNAPSYGICLRKIAV